MNGIDGLDIHIGDFSFFVHQSILIWLVICIITVIILAYAGQKFKKADPSKAPKGVVLVFEQIVNAGVSIIKGNLNENTWKYLPFFGTIMVVMVLSNIMGLFGLQPPTSNLSVTGTLVIMLILLIHGTDIKRHGIRGKLHELAQPNIFLFPLNVIGEIAFPVSLTLRLFGNMLGGTIIVSLLYLLISNLLPFSGVLFTITPFLHMYFDIFVGCIQTYIFFMLASFFLGDALNTPEEEE